LISILKAKDFSWNLNGNITIERRTIKELAGHQSFISGNKWLIQEGGSIGDFYVWKNLGVYQWDQSNAYDATGKLTVRDPIGSIKGNPIELALNDNINENNINGNIEVVISNNNNAYGLERAKANNIPAVFVQNLKNVFLTQIIEALKRGIALFLD